MQTKQQQDRKVSRSSVLPERYLPISIEFDVHGLPAKPEWTDWLCRIVQTGIDDRRGFDDLVRAHRDQYEAVPRSRDLPWVGAANLEPPQTRSLADGIHAHLYKAAFGVDKYFQCAADDPDDTETAQTLENALQSIFTGRIPLARIGGEMLKNAIIDGTAIAMPSWKVEVRKKRDLELIDEHFLATLTAKMEAGGEDVENVEALFDQVKDVPLGSWRVIAREETTYDDACVDVVSVLDFGTYPANPARLDEATAMFCRTWQTRDSLAHGVKSGSYDADAVQELKDRIGSASRGSDAQGGDASRSEGMGLKPDPTINEQDDLPFEVMKGLVRCDVDGDGLSEWVLFEVALAERVLLRAELHPYFHDKPIFVPLTPYPRSGSIYGYSLCGILEQLQEELAVIRNQRVHNGTLKNNTAFTAKRGLKVDFAKTPFRPGMIVPVQDHDDFKPLVLGVVDQQAFAEEDSVRREMREVSGVSETVLGQPTSGETTLGEVERSLQNTNTKFDVLIDNISVAFVEIASQIKALYAQYAPDTMQFNMGTSRAPAFSQVSRAQMQTNVGITVRGTSSLMNKALQAQLAEKVQMLSERSPFIQKTFVRQWHAQALVFEGFGITDYEPLIGTIEDAAKMDEEAANTPPAPPERKVSISERRDEVLTLAMAFKSGDITEEEYLTAAQAAGIASAMLAPAPKDAEIGDATDDAAGYPTEGASRDSKPAKPAKSAGTKKP